MTIAGDLPPWPDDLVDDPASDRSALDEEWAAAQARIVELTASADGDFGDALRDLFDVHARQLTAAEGDLRRRVKVMAAVDAALMRMRRLPNADAMVAEAPRRVCEACGFDRAVIYRVQGRELIAEAFWVKGDPSAAERLLAFSRMHPPELSSRVLESEVVRRRMPMAVHQVVNNPKVLELAGAYDTRSYVTAPIMPEGHVIGFLHADHRLKPRPINELDRDSLWAFAEGLGHAIERSRLTDRLQAQADTVRAALRSAESTLAATLNTDIELVSGEHEAGETSRGRSPWSMSEATNEVFDSLSRREAEVLVLLGAGASNADIARRLFITEETAKSHVKRVLRKLGAPNRVAAAAIWLRSQVPM